MYFFTYLAAFLFITRLKKSLKLSSLLPKWNGLLTVIYWAVIVATCVACSEFSEEWNYFIGSTLLIATLTFADREPDFSHFKSFIKAHYYLIGTSLITGAVAVIAPNFFDEEEKFFDFAILGAFVWIFARWATAQKQQEQIRMVNAQNQVLDNLVAERTSELLKQKDELQETVKLLQTTQQQLIQSEKLASLGELTAGIAHEIQNPLNFVNNFSEVSMELIEEMGEELARGDTEEALVIANDIKQNLEKIRHHGKRADGIVKGMLQHSRASSNVLEPTDINTLADEYFRLAYHGLRAKDKSFNAELVTHFNAAIPKVNMVPQDVGRVLLNLYNNAFYAVQQKQKAGVSGYKPTVTVSTAMLKDVVEIRVRDNGTGIPDEIKDKILQPFFTTKPTGEGTGLGLSLSYDIIVKAHGGTIAIDSREGEYTEFIICIPAKA